MDVIPIDAAPDTVEQRATDRWRYYKAHPSASLLSEGIQAGNMGDWKEALRKIEAAIREEPSNGKARYYQAAGYIELGEWQKTKEVAEDSLEIIPPDDIWRGRLFYVMADALIMLKEESKAIIALEQLLRYKGHDPELSVERIQGKLQLLRTGQGDEIREATYADPRYKHLISGMEGKGKESYVWEHMAGYGFIGISSGLVYATVLVPFFRLIYDANFLKTLVTMWKSFAIELIVAVILGWLIGNIWSFITWSNTRQKTKEMYFKQASPISRAIFICLFIIGDLYFRFSYPANQSFTAYLIMAIVGLMFSGNVGRFFANRVVLAMENADVRST
jgi:tetratricopeptide (TPR) repeat protein